MTFEFGQLIVSGTQMIAVLGVLASVVSTLFWLLWNSVQTELKECKEDRTELRSAQGEMLDEMGTMVAMIKRLNDQSCSEMGCLSRCTVNSSETIHLEKRVAQTRARHQKQQTEKRTV